LQRDLPHLGLNRRSLHYAFSGVRTLALEKGKEVARVSRRHRWEYDQGVLSLIGGKFTTADWTALEGLKKALRLSGIKCEIVGISGRKLPGAGNESFAKKFEEVALAAGASPSIIRRAVQRFGSRVSRIADYTDGLSVINGQVFLGEVKLVMEEEQAQTLEDVMRRRLELEYLPQHGLSAVESIASFVSNPLTSDISGEVSAYRSRLKALDVLLKQSA